MKSFQAQMRKKMNKIITYNYARSIELINKQSKQLLYVCQFQNLHSINSEQLTFFNKQTISAQVPKKPTVLDLIGIEAEDDESLKSKSPLIFDNQNQHNEENIFTSPTQIKNQICNTDEIFQDSIIPSECYEKSDLNKQNGKQQRHNLNSYISIIGQQNKQVFFQDKQQKENDINSQNENIQQQIIKNKQNLKNSYNQTSDLGQGFDLTEFNTEIQNQFDNTDQVSTKVLRKSKEQFQNQASKQIKEQINTDDKIDSNWENTQFDQQRELYGDELEKAFQDDFDKLNLIQNKEQLAQDGKNFKTKQFQQHEKNDEQCTQKQIRSKQRHFSEIQNEKSNLLSLQQQVDPFDFQSTNNEQFKTQPGEWKKPFKKHTTQVLHNSSQNNIFKSTDNSKKMNTRVQLARSSAGPIDFYSQRPPTGYFTVSRGQPGNYQMVDLIQENNVLKQEQKKQLKRDQFMIEFNTDPNLAIKKLEEDQQLNIQNIAEFLSKAEGVRKNTLGQFFGKENQKNQDILREFCKVIDFKEQTIDEALRLPGESQQINRIMSAFSESYQEQNPNTFENSDVAYILAYSIMMLHTDVHSEKIEKKDKMKRNVFVDRTQSVIKSSTVTQEILGGIYDRISAKQFECEQDAFEKAYDLLVASHGDLQDGYSKHLEQDVKYFKNGTIFLKYGRQGNPKEKFVYLSPSEDKICWCVPKTQSSQREILIEDIYEITIGYDKTEVMRKNKVPKQLDHLCFSLLIIGHDKGKRSLDLKAKDEESRNKWIRFCYQKLLNTKQQLFEFKKAKFSMQEYKEEIAGIWKSQIFEQFDKYWDYDRDQPLYMDKYYKSKGQKQEKSKNIWKNVMKKKKQQTQKLNQVGIISESTVIREHIEDLQKNKDLLFIQLWKQGLPHFVRKTLYKLTIGNKLEITEQYFQVIKMQADSYLYAQNNPDQQITDSMQISQAFSQQSPLFRKSNHTIYDKIQQMNYDLVQFLERNPNFKANQEVISNVLAYTLFHRQDLNYMQGMVNIAALIVNIFQSECDSFIYFLNLIFKYHFKPLYTRDKNKNIIYLFYVDFKYNQIEFFNQFFYQSFQKEMKDLHERFIGINLGPQNYLYGWLFSLFSDYFQDINIVYRILDNFLLEGEVYIFKAALGIIKMHEIDLRFSSFSFSLKYLTEVSKNVNEEFLFDTIECIDTNNEDYEKFFNDLKKSQIKSLIHEILVEL